MHITEHNNSPTRGRRALSTEDNSERILALSAAAIRTSSLTPTESLSLMRRRECLAIIWGPAIVGQNGGMKTGLMIDSYLNAIDRHSMHTMLLCFNTEVMNCPGAVSKSIKGGIGGHLYRATIFPRTKGSEVRLQNTPPALPL